MSFKYVTGEMKPLDLSKLLEKIKKEFALKTDKYVSESTPEKS